MKECSAKLKLLDLVVIIVFLLDLRSLTSGFKAELRVTKLLGIKVLFTCLGNILLKILLERLKIINMILLNNGKLILDVLL